MLHYKKTSKIIARKLRKNQTNTEFLLWLRIRRRQIKNIQFYRQKPIANFVVDFYAPSAKLVIEIDGSQHFSDAHLKKDKHRDIVLQSLGLTVLRFDNLQILNSMDAVLEMIFNAISGD